MPVSAPPGALICNYAKDTGGSHVGGKENRKAGGACFSVPVPPTTTTTTIPTQVLGESFSKPPLAFTGENVNRLVAAAGAFVLAGGVLMLAGGRRRSAVRGR